MIYRPGNDGLAANPSTPVPPLPSAITILYQGLSDIVLGAGGHADCALIGRIGKTLDEVEVVDMVHEARSSCLVDFGAAICVSCKRPTPLVSMDIAASLYVA
jgi:hypothetical protein